MSFLSSWRHAFFAAIALHLVLVGLIIMEPNQQQALVTALSPDSPQKIIDTPVVEKQQDIVRASSVNAEDVANVIKKLRAKKLKKQQVEATKQAQIKRAAVFAKRQRIKEERRLKQLKKQAAQLSYKRKKALEEQQRKIEELAEQKLQETQRLKDLQKQQRQAQKLAELERKKANELAAILKFTKDKEAKELAVKKEKERLQKLEEQKQHRAEIAGVVDKYKAMILSAIGRQWILPDNADNDVSSRFRIRLAPDGTVLAVNLSQSSGNSVLDRSAQNAIFKASPLPVPSDPEMFHIFRDISLTVRPEQVRG